MQNLDSICGAELIFAACRRHESERASVENLGSASGKASNLNCEAKAAKAIGLPRDPTSCTPKLYPSSIASSIPRSKPSPQTYELTLQGHPIWLDIFSTNRSASLKLMIGSSLLKKG